MCVCVCVWGKWGRGKEREGDRKGWTELIRVNSRWLTWTASCWFVAHLLPEERQFILCRITTAHPLFYQLVHLRVQSRDLTRKQWYCVFAKLLPIPQVTIAPTPCQCTFCHAHKEKTCPMKFFLTTWTIITLFQHYLLCTQGENMSNEILPLPNYMNSSSSYMEL